MDNMTSIPRVHAVSDSPEEAKLRTATISLEQRGHTITVATQVPWPAAHEVKALLQAAFALALYVGGNFSLETNNAIVLTDERRDALLDAIGYYELSDCGHGEMRPLNQEQREHQQNILEIRQALERMAI